MIARITANEKEVETELLGHSQAKHEDLKAEVANFEKVVFPDFVKKLSAIKEPRFAAIDFFFPVKEQGSNVQRFENKIIVMRWSPDGANGKLKMMYSSGEGSFKNKLSTAKMFQAIDAADLAYNQMCSFVQAK